MIRDVEVRSAGGKGRGVYARRAFVEGGFIFRRRHTCVLTARELPDASEWQRAHLCELGFDRFAVLARGPGGGGDGDGGGAGAGGGDGGGDGGGTEPMPGFGHPLYLDGDPRAAHLLAGLADAYVGTSRRGVVHRALGELAASGQPPPNFDFARGALCYVARLQAGAAEAIFALGRVAGFLAHWSEQRASATRYRLSAVYVGPGPVSAAR